MTTLTGTVQNGVVVLDGPVPPDGTRVSLTVLPELPSLPAPGDAADAPPGPHAWMLKYAGALDMPADFAEQHDRYIHGTPQS